MKLTVEEIAKVCHNTNMSYCQSIGDNTQPTWELAPQWQKESAINGVKFHIENPLKSPKDSHENWMKEKWKDGWKYGKVKDADKKEHPCYMKYEDLPQSQRSKDYIFKQIIVSLANI